MEKGSPSIVVACDGSEQSSGAAKMAAELAKATGQPLKLVSVYPYSKSSTLVVAGVEHSKIEAEKQKYGREVFDAAKEAMDKEVPVAEEVLLHGDPAHEILEYMQGHPGTHLVLGRRGHSMVRSLTLGSVSEKIVRHAVGPVTVVGA
ncbi:universal stress protein UspA [Marinobacter salinus]|uniref:Universal stress protein UspA n=1 Tax=Marinobacter salinus TaxID=1874317 RepID=A0A1D9GGR5_9GAMM|nr:universal stress protein [Marinobacter salinus]AOY86837.1 universal stress protein UspA [Marinobacter salinus]